MKKTLLSHALGLLCCIIPTIIWGATTITGAGATFPYPLYVKWAAAYQQQTGVAINYQPIGSGGGIKQVLSKTVDFGASDKPLSNEELTQQRLIQFPTVVGGVTPVINLKNLQQPLRLSGAVLADIYLGKITRWNDKAIANLNSQLELPNTPITVVHRSDGSGTSFLFTDYLSKVSPTWREQIGADTAVAWPTGIGGKGNEGVASYVQRIDGSIGYVEFAYATRNKLAPVRLINRYGKTVDPSLASFQAVTQNVEWDIQSGFSAALTNQYGHNSWPIVGATFIIMSRQPTNSDTARATLRFFDWAYQHGQQMALDLDYAPLPQETVALIHRYWQDTITDRQGKALWQQTNPSN